MKFVEIPYLPQNKITLGVGDVKREDVKIIPPCEFLNLPPTLKRHADLSFCYLGKGVGISAKGSGEYYKKVLGETGIKLYEGEKIADRHYPSDAAYNVAIVGKRLFCRVDITDRVLLEKAQEMGYKIINMNQGYGKCSVCPVGENWAISADASFRKAAEKEGIEVLLITNESIVLPGYNNGFFGGAAYMEDKETLCINGDLSLHPDREKIEEFLSEKHIRIKSEKGVPVFDFGSLIGIMEE